MARSPVNQDARQPGRCSRWRRSAAVLVAACSTIALVAPLTLTSDATALNACAAYDFESGAQGWRSWWSGTIEQSRTARSGSASLSSSGSPATLAVDLRPDQCTTPIVSVTLQLRAGWSTVVHVKTADLATGATRLMGPIRLGTDWTEVTVPLDLRHPTTLGVEASGTSALFVDDVTLDSAAAAPQTTVAPAAGCAFTFDAGLEAWAAGWAGWITHTGVARTGPGSLAAVGNPTTASRTFGSECGPGSLRVFARAYGGNRSVYLKQTGASGASTQAGPFSVGDAWTELATASLPGPFTLTVEASGTGDLLIDDVSSATSPGATNPPATSPQPTSPPATSPQPTSPPATSPPATSPPVETCSFGFESGLEGWSTWWSGSVGRGPGRNGASLYIAGAPGTTQRVVRPAACGRLGVRLWLRADGGTQRTYIKVRDADGSVYSLVGPVEIPASWTSVDAALPAATATISLESYPTASAGLMVDDVQLGVDVTTTTAPPSTAPPLTQPPTTQPPATQPPATQPPGGGTRCVAILHGVGGSGSDPVQQLGVTVLQPFGNLWTASGRAWDYLSDGRVRENLAAITSQVNTSGCAQVVLVGFSNGGGMAASILCRGETFGGRLRGVILDDPVLDSVPVNCARPASVGVNLLYTQWMADIGAQGGVCDTGWICLGTRQSVWAYASQVGASVAAKTRGHELEPDHVQRASAYWR